ncbi:MAG: D-glycero-D-manno-heptose 1,7-bisphosphate phosphatase [Verrucomicrobiales bacterium]
MERNHHCRDSNVKRPAVFFDRDGVVNVSPGSGYITSWSDFVLTEGIREALKLCKQRGYLTALVTSQRCVSKGLITIDKLQDLHSQMQESLGYEAQFDSIHAFTGLPGSEPLEKPRPGLILAAAEELNIDLTRSWLVGDADRDIAMAHNAGVPTTVRVQTHHAVGVTATWTVDSVMDLTSVLDEHLPVV